MTTVEEPKQYASESGHWYTRDGIPMHEVPYADPRKGMRPTTLRDARKLNLLPSVSSILKTIAKPGLDTWKVDQYLSEAYNMVPIEGEEKTEWISSVRNRADTLMSYCRDLGTEVHGAINRHFKGEDSDPKFDPFLEAAVESLRDIGVWDLQVSQDLLSERTFASAEFGYAGCVDLSTNKSRVIVDWKCVDRLDKQKAFIERCAQAVSYGRGLYGNVDFRCFNIFICTNEPGKYEIKEWDQDEQRQGWEVFDAANKLYRAINNYHP